MRMLQRRPGPTALRRRIRLTGHERVLAEDDIIVSKTDATGRITYANDVFVAKRSPR